MTFIGCQASPVAATRETGPTTTHLPPLPDLPRAFGFKQSSAASRILFPGLRTNRHGMLYGFH